MSSSAIVKAAAGLDALAYRILVLPIDLVADFFRAAVVALRARAWVETLERQKPPEAGMVALRARAWVETRTIGH